MFIVGLILSLLAGDFAIDSVAWMMLVITAVIWILRDLANVIPRLTGPNWLERLLSVAPSFMIVLVFIVYGGIVYGTSIYLLIPRVIGGGEPVPIQVTLRNSADLNTMAVDSETTGQSDAFCFLAQATDGIIVYHPESDRGFSIRFPANMVAYYSTPSDLEINCLPPGTESGSD